LDCSNFEFSEKLSEESCKSLVSSGDLSIWRNVNKNIAFSVHVDGQQSSFVKWRVHEGKQGMMDDIWTISGEIATELLGDVSFMLIGI